MIFSAVDYFGKSPDSNPLFLVLRYLWMLSSSEREGQCAVYNTIVPKVLLQRFSYSLAKQLLGLSINFDWLVY